MEPGRSCARRCRCGWRGGDCGPHTRRMRFVAVPRVEATYELPDMFVVVYDYVDGVTLDH